MSRKYKDICVYCHLLASESLGLKVVFQFVEVSTCRRSSKPCCEPMDLPRVSGLFHKPYINVAFLKHSNSNVVMGVSTVMQFWLTQRRIAPPNKANIDSRVIASDYSSV